MVPGAVFFISLSDSLFLMCRNVTSFCILAFYPETWLNSLMNYSSFFGTAFKISVFSIMSSPSDSFTASFSVWVLLASISYLISVAGTFTVILNKRDKIGHPCLIPDLRGNDFSFPLYSRMLAVGLSYMTFIMMRYVPSIPTLWRVLPWVSVEFCQMVFSASVDMIICFYPLFLCRWYLDGEWYASGTASVELILWPVWRLQSSTVFLFLTFHRGKGEERAGEREM